MTEKLYYKDAYIKSFSAVVLSVDALGENYGVVLDKTAFFPEEGGQSADKGKIDSVNVIDVREEGGKIIHLTDAPLEVGKSVECVIDFDERYEKMKCHTAEHILCGLFHRLYGAENIGFHLGDDAVTFDISTVLGRDELNYVEDIANGIISENVKVTAAFPTAEELSALSYRAKLDLTENVRIVSIGDYDSCACCAPHVLYTGEIGLIKMLDFCKHRGGIRIYMVAGKRALSDYRARYAITQKISALTSTPQMDIIDAVEQLQRERNELKLALKERGFEIAKITAEAVVPTDKNTVHFFDCLDVDEIREFVNLTVPKVGGMVVALWGDEGDYKFIVGSKAVNLKNVISDITLALGGRGGGKSEMVQGSFKAKRSEIEAFFAK